METQEPQQEIPPVVIEQNRYAFVIDEEVEVEPVFPGFDSKGRYMDGSE